MLNKTHFTQIHKCKHLMCCQCVDSLAQSLFHVVLTMKLKHVLQCKFYFSPQQLYSFRAVAL